MGVIATSVFAYSREPQRGAKQQATVEGAANRIGRRCAAETDAIVGLPEAGDVTGDRKWGEEAAQQGAAKPA